jgi:hypothetical protein
VLQFYNLMPSLTAYENVALVTEIAECPMRPDEALALVGLDRRMNHFQAELSGASSSASPSRAPLPSGLKCCPATSQPVPLIPRPGSKSSKPCCTSMRNSGYGTHHHPQRQHSGGGAPRPLVRRPTDFWSSHNRGPLISVSRSNVLREDLF